MRTTRTGIVVLLAGLVLSGCRGADEPAGDGAATGFEPVRAGASGFTEAAPQPLAAGRLSVSKTIDGATFFGRVEDAGPSGLPEGEGRRFRLAEASAPSEDGGECLARTSRTHLNGMVRGGSGVAFVLAEGADIADPGGVPVHVWVRGVWVNGEVLARGYGVARDDGGSRRSAAAAAEEFARERGEGVWNASLCPPEGS